MKILTVYGTPDNSGNIIRTRYINKELIKLGNQVTEIPPIRRMPYQSNFIYSIPVYFPQIFKGLYDFIFTSKPYPNASIVAFLKKIQGSKIIADIDDLTFMYHEKGAMRLILKFFEDFLPKYFDLVCIHNKNVANYMLKHGVESKKIYNLPNGVDLSLFNPKLYDKYIFRKKLGLKNEKIILYLANLDISSELEIIIKGLKNVIKLKQVRFVVVGSGVLKNYYRNLISKMGLINNVIFTDYVPLKDVPGYINTSDCCIVYYSDRCASYYRTSMKIREYLAMGKAVVCNNLGDLNNFKDFTFNFQTKDLDQFENNVLQVLNEKNERLRILKGQKYVRDNFSWEKIIKEFDKKLKSII